MPESDGMGAKCREGVVWLVFMLVINKSDRVG